MPKKRFSGIFGRKFFFSKIGLRHIFDIIILRQCAKFHEKISSTARHIQEILFFRRKLAVPAIFSQFRLQKSVFLTIETCLIMGIAINNVFLWKNNEIWRKNPNKICKIGDFRHISGIFGRKKNFSKIGLLGHVLSIVNTRLWAKNYKNLVMKSWEKSKKPSFPA